MENELILNIDKIHTTELGGKRIERNLHLNGEDSVQYCKKLILSEECSVYKKGKNYYCENGNAVITVNSYSFTIITAHLIKKKI